MDFSNELKNIMNKSLNIEQAFEIIEEEKKELRIKAHILWVASIGNLINELIENKIFEKHGVTEINIFNDTNVYNRGNNLTIQFYDAYHQQIYPSLNPDDFILFKKLIQKLNFSENHVSKNVTNKGIFIKVDENFCDVFMNYLLSDNMKKIMEYNKLQIALSDQDIKTKRIKL